MTTKEEAVTKLIKKAIAGINALPTSTHDPAFMPTLMQALSDLEASVRLLDLVQCEIKAQAEKL